MGIVLLWAQVRLASAFQALRRRWRWRWLDGPARRIVRIRVYSMYESCQRSTYFVEITTDEGFTMTPCCHRTGSLYTNFEGLSKEDARERALLEAHEWGDFLQIAVDTFEEDGAVHRPDFPMETYTTQRELVEHRRD